ncbi:hypothetical protein SPHINGOR109_11029 [Sphingorhabdus sp. 109]|nr:hypothetical protein SPHINGOR109_11029 [Sphingorhabdus sp. 109]
MIGNLADTIHHIFLDRLALVELGLLFQIADGNPVSGPGLTGKFCVLAGHDLHQGRFADAVRTDNADLGIGIKLQTDIIQYRLLLVLVGLGQTLHDEGILGGHVKFSLVQVPLAPSLSIVLMAQHGRGGAALTEKSGLFDGPCSYSVRRSQETIGQPIGKCWRAG